MSPWRHHRCRLSWCCSVMSSAWAGPPPGAGSEKPSCVPARCNVRTVHSTLPFACKIMYQLIHLYPSDNFAHRYGVYPEDRFAIAPDWNHHNGRLVLCMQSPANAGSTRHRRGSKVAVFALHRRAESSCLFRQDWPNQGPQAPGRRTPGTGQEYEGRPPADAPLLRANEVRQAVR